MGDETLDGISEVETRDLDETPQPVPERVLVHVQRRGGRRDVPEAVEVGAQRDDVLGVS